MSRLPIRARLTLVFAAAMVVVIGAMAVLVYLRVGGALLTSTDQTLRAQAHEAVTHARGEGELVDPDVGSGRTLAQLLGADGKPERSTPSGLPPLLGSADAARVARGARVLRTARLTRPAGQWRVLAVPLAGGGAVVVARSLAEREEALHRIFRELLIAGPLAVLLASLAGYGLAAAALRPVEAMRRRAAVVSASAPGVLPVPRSNDEISRLAVTLNQMLSRLQSSIEHERRFVADASHELRTPLALLRTEIELALRRPRSADELRAALRSALDETDRLSRLANDLLLLARAEDGPFPLSRKHTAVSSLFETVSRRFASRASAANRTLRIAPSAAMVDGDPDRLEQALDNLVENSLCYGAGDIELFALEPNGTVELHVADAGGGFEDDFLARAFDRFSRADHGRPTGGAGLGLSIVRLIAEAHGGGVGAANRQTGGADVWLTLPHHS